LLLVVLAGLAVRTDGASVSVSEISQRLAVVTLQRGEFAQQRDTAGLSHPLVSAGVFVLSQSDGLLWQVRMPLQADYKFVPAGTFRRLRGRDWQSMSVTGGATDRYMQVMRAVMSGDLTTLSRDFDISVSGDAMQWTLTLRPRGRLLTRALRTISVLGGDWIQRVVIEDQSGSRTTISLSLRPGAPALSPDEARDLAS
jgi:hypothetical protein